jgi:undecaprenyl pyrophosphate phosphatase UppP
VRWMVAYLQKHPLSIFGWYRLAAAGVAAGLVASGTL